MNTPEHVAATVKRGGFLKLEIVRDGEGLTPDEETAAEAEPPRGL